MKEPYAYVITETQWQGDAAVDDVFMGISPTLAGAAAILRERYGLKTGIDHTAKITAYWSDFESEVPRHEYATGGPGEYGTWFVKSEGLIALHCELVEFVEG